MTFYDASTDPDLAVEAVVLGEVARAAENLGIEVLVIGAVARDIRSGVSWALARSARPRRGRRGRRR